MAQLVTCLPAGREQLIIMFYVYALQSLKDGGIYIGLSQDCERRLRDHNRGHVKSTKARLPFKIIYKEKAANRKETRALEKKLKSGSGREFLRDKIIRSGSVG